MKAVRLYNPGPLICQGKIGFFRKKVEIGSIYMKIYYNSRLLGKMKVSSQ